MIACACALTAFAPAKTTQSEFCRGFKEGLKDGAESCFKVALDELCPWEPVNSKGYKTGYAMGWSHAVKKYCDE